MYVLPSLATSNVKRVEQEKRRKKNATCLPSREQICHVPQRLFSLRNRYTKGKILAKSDIRKFSEQSELDFIFLKKRCLRGLKM